MRNDLDARGSSVPRSRPMLLKVVSVLRRPCPDGFFVYVDPPSRTRRQDEFAVLDCRDNRIEFVAPRSAVDVDLHDPEIRHDRAERRADGTAQMAIEIMRGDIDLIDIGHRSDLR